MVLATPVLLAPALLGSDSCRILRARRSTVVLLVLVWLFAVVPSASAALPPGGTFIDDNGSAFEPSIEAVAAEGITNGCNPPLNDLYCPRDAVTRGQMAAFLVRALDLTATGGSDFVDVSGTFAVDIDKLATAGITRGCNAPVNDRFCPNDVVTRGQMAAFLVRGLGLTATSGITFTDVPPGHTFRGDINRLATAGITTGCGNGQFCPNDVVTRGQMAAFLQRALDLDPITPPPPVAGNPTGNAPIPPEARAVDTSDPDRVVGTGTPGSCTSTAVVNAVAQGGKITFDCGPNPVTISMNATARVFNDQPNVVLDGGGLVTLDGQGDRRILYMNTCDPDLVWTTSHCQNQDHPTLVRAEPDVPQRPRHRQRDHGRWRARSSCVAAGSGWSTRSSSATAARPTGPDVGGAALQVFSQYHGPAGAIVVNSTFGGPGSHRPQRVLQRRRDREHRRRRGRS